MIAVPSDLSAILSAIAFGDGGSSKRFSIARLRRGFGGQFSFRFGKKTGGAGGARTRNPRFRRPMLYPLSYRPTAFSQHVAGRTVRSVTRNLAAPTVDKSGPVGNPNLGDKPPEVASQFLRGRSNSRAGRPCHVAWASRPCRSGAAFGSARNGKPFRYGVKN